VDEGAAGNGDPEGCSEDGSRVGKRMGARESTVGVRLGLNEGAFEGSVEGWIVLGRSEMRAEGAELDCREGLRDGIGVGLEEGLRPVGLRVGTAVICRDGNRVFRYTDGTEVFRGLAGMEGRNESCGR